MDGAPSFINGVFVVGLITFIACCLFAWIGISIMSHANKADMAKTSKTAGGALIGAVFVIIGITGGVIGLATGIYQAVKK